MSRGETTATTRPREGGTWMGVGWAAAVDKADLATAEM
jgi:hypothetical protein